MTKRFAALAVGLFGLFVVAGAAMAQDGFQWHYSRYLDPDPFKTQLTLIYGVPESDAVQVVAQCQIGAGGTYATLELGAEIGDLPENATVEVEFVGSGFHHVATGDVVGTDREEGIRGASLALQLDDPLWGAIRGLSELHYNVVGFRALRLSLRGSSGPTQDFLRDCTDMPGPDDVAGEAPASQTPPPPPPSPAASGGQAISCGAFGGLKSVGGGAATSVTFINRSEGYRTVMWLDYEGTPKEYRSLNPGEAYTQETAVGHPWMITDGPGNCLEIHMPVPGGGVFEITAPNQDFGAE